MWPDDDYLHHLGRAAYGFAYLEWGIIYLAAELDPDQPSVNRSAGLAAGLVAAMLRNAIAASKMSADVLADAKTYAAEFDRLIPRRNDIVHAHPATIEGDQRLHRRRPAGTTLTIQVELLDAFVDDCLSLSGQVGDLFWDLRDGRRS
jgi:hypothetical protein